MSKCNHDWILVADILQNESMKFIFPTKRYCDRCGKIGNTSDADYTKIDKAILDLT